MSFTHTNLAQAETHLAAHQHLSGTDKPSKLDADLFNQLKENKVYLDPNTHPNLYAWYGWISLFSPEVKKSWESSTQKVVASKAPAAKKDDDIDLFGDDDENEDDKAAAEALAKKQKEIAEKAKAKKKVIAKTIIVFDVKVYEESEDLDALAKKIFDTINPDGLVWNKDYKTPVIAYTMRKLQIGCVVEDDKVQTDDIFDKILEWEDVVQSVDIASMQKV
ncbi:hypothetical protein IMG5_016510 [Ichthyophthirius multifiliis]|uniref:Translation elongation factor EF1B beta/delta subunit guanine nucleotide exchange domain-containing protein n=1 Tax=Ichthyophthirius multifiliis TaxID=5932 RepID=G0QKD8_ICHMU|nr:hypothetical protein IMG5_016510 [Ichthyophthirius multifiliis]EGR34312.1 hypothetical protein IMG5_016510 [Ichthyophthirius multifiliis]|eukprot:XP_004039616.1 hypothetical protein IMG5_016510 [Ichthyophthirius multifiliis]